MKLFELAMRMRRWTAVGIASLMAAGSVASAGAAQVIKLTTLAPKDHSFHRSLLKMGQTWRQISGGQVDLIVYPGGIQGGEAAMVDRMNINQVQAAMLTAVGLAEIEPDVSGLQNMPMMFRDFAEVDYVQSELRPRLEKQMRAKGYVVLFWADTGWVRFFSRSPAVRPDDFRRLKMFTWAGHSAQVDIMKESGFRPVPLETSDILVSLQNGLIDAVPNTPFYALYTQIYSVAPHMLEIAWAPLVGATVITSRAWDRIPAAWQPEFQKAAAAAGQEIRAAGRAEGDQAVRTMKEKWGLKVHAMTPEIEAEWRQLAEGIYPKIRGAIVPVEIFDEVQRKLATYRAERAGSP